MGNVAGPINVIIDATEKRGVILSDEKPAIRRASDRATLDIAA